MKRKGPVTRLKELFFEKTAEVKELKDKYLRALAELDNYRKRKEKEFDDFKRYSKVDFFIKIIPVLDNFDRAIGCAELNGDFQNFYRGIEIIYRQLKETLKTMGLVEFSGIGETFDPGRHEAVAIVATTDKPENTIIEEISKGYIVSDRVIKPAKVMVSKPPAPPANTNGGNKAEENRPDIEENRGGQDNGESNRY